MSFIFVLAKTYALQYAEKAVAVSLLPQLLYLLYLRLKYIENLTESLKMHYFTFTQEFYHIAYVRIIADSEDVVIGSSGFLLRRKIFVNIGERIGFALDVCGGKRHTAGIGWVNRICVIHIICAYSVSVKALCALACCELGYYRAYHFEMG